MKIIKTVCSFVILIMLSGCAEYVILDNYSLEIINDSEVPVCVNSPRRVIKTPYEHVTINTCGEETRTPKYEETGDMCDILPKEIVSYSHCLAQMPKPVHLVQKQENDITICYDRNNKVQLPISYCQQDITVIQNTTVSQFSTMIW